LNQTVVEFSIKLGKTKLYGPQGHPDVEAVLAFARIKGIEFSRQVADTFSLKHGKLLIQNATTAMMWLSGLIAPTSNENLEQNAKVE
jgi:hypothetical protein